MSDSIVNAPAITADSLVSATAIHSDSVVEAYQIVSDSRVQIGAPGAPGYSNANRERLTPYPDGERTSFFPPSGKTILAGTEWVKCNGIPNQAPYNYSLIGANEIVFTTPPGVGWYLTIEYEEVQQ